jgi:tRNA-uridine 2-sulfurtransferase
MPDERFEEHLTHPVGRGHVPAGSASGAAGGAACGDLVRLDVVVRDGVVADAGFEASGCGAVIAAGSAAVDLVRGRPVLEAARVGGVHLAGALGGLSPGKLHAADLAADALARALGSATAAAGPVAPVPGRVLVAMSGGVDSAVAALLSRGQGDEVAAVTLELWRDPENDGERSCCSASAVRTTRSLAHRMGLPHLTLDLRDAFRAGVVEPWLADHAAGLTPNPCVRCNGSVRLDAMLDLADRLGAEALATGHYARKDGESGLLRLAADPAKDQAYMLAGLSRRSLARLRFPLGELSKPDVRALAAEHDLPVAHTPDSQDLCFLAGTGRTAFLASHGGLGDREGDLLDAAGRRVGRHRGAHLYTVGQRRGLGTDGGTGAPLYVLRTDVEANTVTVGPRDALATEVVPVRDLRLHAPAREVEAVKLRYRAAPIACTLRDNAVRLAQPILGAAPGQTAVFLRGDRVLGCATISS